MRRDPFPSFLPRPLTRPPLRSLLLALGLAALAACAAPPKGEEEPEPPRGANKWAAMGAGLMNSTVGTQFPAFDAALPYDTDVEPGEPTAIDGYWRLDANKKLYRIDRGRVIADEDYPQFPFMVRRGMVVVKDLERVGEGEYLGRDIGAMGEWRASLHEDGSLLVRVQNKVSGYDLRMVRSDLGTPMPARR